MTVGIDDKRTAFDLVAISYHEAGHGLVAAILGAKVESLDIELTPDRWGIAEYRNRPVNDIPRLAIISAGYVAELRAIGKVHTDIDYSTQDVKDAMRLIRERHGGDATIETPEHRAGILLAEKIIRKHWSLVRRLARRLRSKRRLTAQEVSDLFKSQKRKGRPKCTTHAA